MGPSLSGRSERSETSPVIPIFAFFGAAAIYLLYGAQ
jgi:hypothetical protein